MSTNVAIIDYGLGNLASVKKAFSAAGANVCISSNPREIRTATHVVLPGQGAYGEGMENLKKRHLIGVLETQVLKKNRPFLGICLGMQLLGKSSTEGGFHKGLGWLPGIVEKISDHPNVRLPHMGWDDIMFITPSAFTKGIKNESDFYFAHSYVLKLAQPDLVIATCTYGETFPAMIEANNIHATMFHPEKSQDNGLRLIQNFLHFRS